MSKKDALKTNPQAYCCKDHKNGRFYILDHSLIATKPVFPHGHASAAKAWREFMKICEAEVK